MRRAADDAVRRAAAEPARPTRRSRRSADRRAVGALEVDEARLRRRLGGTRADRALRKLAAASEAFADERFEDARQLLRTLADLLPDEPAVHELYGLTLYRLGRWRSAARELTAFADRTGSTEQHPVLADCHRALGHHTKVEELWAELGEASPEAALVAEGRIVYAGSLADRGRLVDAIALLEAAPLGRGRLQVHHLRLRYALADLYDRAGDRRQATRLFESIRAVDPAFADVQARLRD